MSTKPVRAKAGKRNHKRQNYLVEQSQEHGVVRIADEVIASIAGIAATEIEGVIRLNGNITNELVSKMSVKNLAKGVHIKVEDKKVCIDLNCELRYGSNLPEVTRQIQKKVKQNVENMTGLEVQEVNVYVAAVSNE